MTRPRVVLNGALPNRARARAETLFELLDVSDRPEPSSGVAGRGAGIRAILTSPGRGAGPELLRCLPDLETVVLTGAGMDLVDRAQAEARGITLQPTGALLAEDVADTALLLMMASVRGLLRADAHVRSGDWARLGPLPLTRSASGRRVGILGYGSIGQALARRLHALNCDIRYCTRRPVAGAEAGHVADLTALAHWAEVLVLALPGGPATTGIVGGEVLRALGPQGTLINVARGSVVDETALIAALRDGTLGAAGLDVFATEPSPDPGLVNLPNTVLMPHCGSASIDAREAAAGEAVRRLAELYCLPA